TFHKPLAWPTSGSQSYEHSWESRCSVKKLVDWVCHSITHIVISHVSLAVLTLLGGMGIIAHSKKSQIETKDNQIQTLEGQRAIITTPKGIYAWQVSSKDVRWVGKIDVDEKGRVTAINMRTIEFCPDGVRELELVESFDMNAAKFELKSVGETEID